MKISTNIDLLSILHR